MKVDSETRLSEVLDLVDLWVQQNPSIDQFSVAYTIAGGELKLSFQRPRREPQYKRGNEP